jgi:hypothetical protein
MAQPQKFTRTIDFTERDGDDTNHSAINEEFDAAALSVNQIRDNITLIQRDDGALKNGIVTADALSQSAFDAVLLDVNAVIGTAQEASQSALTSALTANTASDAALLSEGRAQTAEDASALNARSARDQALLARDRATASGDYAAAAEVSSIAANANSANVNIVAGIRSAINSVAGNAANINEAVANTANINSAVNNASNINAAVANEANINAAVDSAAIAVTKAGESAASAAESLSYLQAYRATSYGALAADPTIDPNGGAPTVGDEYFNTTANLIKRFNGTTWQASDISTANLAAPTGSSLVGFMPAGTGAVARTAQDKMREIVSVLDFGKTSALVKSLSGVIGEAEATIRVNGFHSNGDGGEGVFYWDATANKNTHNGGTIIDPSVSFPTDWANATQREAWFTASGVGTGVWKRADTNIINLKWFGAVGDYTQDEKESINKFILVWIAGLTPGYIPKGQYRTTDRVLINVAYNPSRICPELRGDGPYTSTIISTSAVAPVIHIYGSSAGPDHFQGRFSRLGFWTDVAGTGFAIGLVDYSDNHGNYTFDQCFFGNTNSTGSMEAITLQLNWLFDCLFSGCVVVGKPNKGTALKCRRTHFCQFDGGSYSNAYYGVLITEGGSYSTTFDTPDLENINYAFYVDDITAEYIKVNNAYIDVYDPIALAYPAGAYPVYVGGINSGGIVFDSPRVGRLQSELYGSPGFISPSSANYRSSILMRGFYRSQTTPTLPASDSAQFNWTGQVQRVRVWGGTVTTIFVNNTDIGETRGEFILRPGEFLAVRYSSAPSWEWKALP